jgi:hypothetical protein
MHTAGGTENTGTTILWTLHYIAFMPMHTRVSHCCPLGVPQTARTSARHRKMPPPMTAAHSHSAHVRPRRCGWRGVSHGRQHGPRPQRSLTHKMSALLLVPLCHWYVLMRTHGHSLAVGGPSTPTFCTAAPVPKRICCIPCRTLSCKIPVDMPHVDAQFINASRFDTTLPHRQVCSIAVGTE